jgi:hypothetical protein
LICAGAGLGWTVHNLGKRVSSARVKHTELHCTQ